MFTSIDQSRSDCILSEEHTDGFDKPDWIDNSESVMSDGKKGGDITLLLKQMRDGNESARETLFRQLQDVMKSTANRLMADERDGHTLQPTAVVNEAVLKLMTSDLFRKATNRRYLFASANKAMRDILVDHARSRDAAKRTGGRSRSSLDNMLDALWERDRVDIRELNDALEVLRDTFPRQAEVTELRFFSGLDNQEIADLLETSLATVKRDWLAAKARLKILMGQPTEAAAANEVDGREADGLEADEPVL